MKKFGKRGGFSLLELLAVVTILGIIASIIVPRVTVSSTTAKEKVRAHHLATMNAAFERYYIEENAWPAAITDLVPDYLPDGAPTDPTGTGYTVNGTSHRVE